MIKTSLLPNETFIKGESSLKEGKFMPSETTQRINFLTENLLKKASTRDGGWTILYVDESDGRYWEKFYADYNEHDAGPPSLQCISKEEAKRKYNL